MKQKTEKLTCVQCHENMEYKAGSFRYVEAGVWGDTNVYVCTTPHCPCYALLAIPQEQMPMPEDDNARTASYRANPELAKLCVWCGKTYEEHRNEPLPSGAVPKMPCTGLKQYFGKLEVRKAKNDK